MMIYCCACEKDVSARSTTGREIYSHRKDLHGLWFWVCDACGNYVGCHSKTKDKTRPLGCIPTSAMRTARTKLHSLIDPIWQSEVLPRREVYRRMSIALCVDKFHVANLRSLAELEDAYACADHTFARELNAIKDKMNDSRESQTWRR